MSECIIKIQNLLDDASAALICSAVNRRYLTGFNSSDGYLLITKKDAVFFADSRYIEAAKNTVQGAEVLLLENLGSIKEHLERLKITKAYVEVSFVSISGFASLSENLSVKLSRSPKIDAAIRNSRQIKSDYELLQIEKAAEISDKAFGYILGRIAVGRTEREIALELEFYMRGLGSEGVAFDTIAVSGKNSSMPHGVPTDKKLKKGDFLTLDFGAVVNGYRSDITRTVAVGFATDKMKMVYDTVLKAQLAALKEIKAGKRCCDIDKTARDIINDAGFAGKFGHALGHSVGLDIHESPNFSPRDAEFLKEGMVLSVEPGIYLEGELGVRIEDIAAVTACGHKNFTNSPKELIVI